MKLKEIAETVLKKAVINTVQKPSACIWSHGVEKMPESMKKAR